MDKKTFKRGLALLSEAFPNRIMNPDIYWEILKDIANDNFIYSVNKIIKCDKELFPNTNLMAVIRANSVQEEKLLSGEAWQVVLKEVSRIGSYGTPVFEDKLIERSVNALGWKNICLSENQIADRAHFMKIYDTMQDRERNNKICGNVTKLIESINKNKEIKNAKV